jgi:hypothetical protein
LRKAIENQALNPKYMDKQLVPKENIEIYCYLYSIENALRELIIDSLNTVDGPRWYKWRIPGDILKKYRDGIEYEKNIKWTQLVPHHPIYYIEFPDLKKIIVREDNWKDVFKNIFFQKEVLSNTLYELESIRNKIAHNRKTTYKDVEVVKAAYIKLSEAVGKDSFNRFSARCTCSMDTSERLTELQKESEKLFCVCKSYKPLEKLGVWKEICDEWWFDETYLGHKLDGIINYFKTIEEYATLPRTRGSGYKIEDWVKSNDIETKYRNAKIEFLTVLDNGDKNGESK